MGLSNVERQRRYRARQRAVDGDTVRLSTDISVQGKARLERLARHHGVSQRQALERVLQGAERALVDTLGRAEQAAYYDG